MYDLKVLANFATSAPSQTLWSALMLRVMMLTGRGTIDVDVDVDDAVAVAVSRSTNCC